VLPEILSVRHAAPELSQCIMKEVCGSMVICSHLSFSVSTYAVNALSGLEGTFFAI